jgi:hypothetical protein
MISLRVACAFKSRRLIGLWTIDVTPLSDIVLLCQVSTNMASEDNVGKSLLATALVAGTIAAVVELIPVLGIQSVALGVSPTRVFQSIASGLLGKAAYTGGLSAAAAGAGLHWLISVLAALTFAWVAVRWRDLIRHPVLSGLGYGVIVFAIMAAIVVPLSAAAFKPNTNPTLMAVSMAVHMVFFGLPIALATRCRYRRAGWTA